MDFRTPDGPRRYDAVIDVTHSAVVALDFDGTLAPIVDDPTAAVIHADAPATLIELSGKVRAIAVVTGRPARQVVELGGFNEVADAMPGGCTLYVMGQYGHERWSSDTRTFEAPEPPRGLAAFRAELPRLLEAGRAQGAFIEEKGLAIGVHTRRLADPEAAFVRLEPAIADAAERHGLVLEPGRRVLEVRAPGTHKGDAVHTLAGELHPGALVFIGDDLGDMEAFVAVRALEDESGIPGLLVCSGSEEQEALAAMADLVVDGPDGVVAFLHALTATTP